MCPTAGINSLHSVDELTVKYPPGIGGSLLIVQHCSEIFRYTPDVFYVRGLMPAEGMASGIWYVLIAAP